MSETPEGVSAYLTVEGATICTPPQSPPSNSFAFVMLYDKNNSGHYVQAGYNWLNGCMKDFTEYNTLGTQNSWVRTVYGSCLSANNVITARVLYLGQPGPYPPCCGQTEMYVDGYTTILDQDIWYLGWSFTPAFFGEVNFWQNDIPGSTAHVTDIPGMGIQSVDTGQLRVIPCYLKPYLPANSRFHYGYYGCDHIWVWTNPLTP